MIKILQVKSCKDKRAFIDLPYRLYKGEKNWVPPLKMERHEFFNPKKNPYFDNARVQLFVALKDGIPAGRLSAQINNLHNNLYHENTGHFGCFECTNDTAVAQALFQTAENWLKMQGMNRVVGPFSLSINEESGILIKGYDARPYPFMPYNYPYYAQLIEERGYTKIKDLIAWNYDSSRPIPEAAAQIAAVVKTYPGLTVREVDPKKLKRDVKIIRDVFNSAWSKNWGFIPWTDAEVDKLAKDFKLILNPRLALIAEVNGEPAAISIAFPNYHEAIADLNGRLFPFGLIKFLYRLKTNKIRSSRLALLGIKKEYRHDVLAGLSVYLYTEMHRRSHEIGQIGGELSWTLDDNIKINTGISLMGGEPHKTYRIYEKGL
ncbi:MAG: N-acetyltransferase [Deltaproteobacteria bacterium]|nr:N-acetyltransferase [Deltaproteobacteria bacterium]